jgi:hypothetical protein
MPAATVRCHLDSLAGRICARARGSGLAWTLRWQALLGLLLCTVLLAWWGYSTDAARGIGWTGRVTDPAKAALRWR